MLLLNDLIRLAESMYSVGKTGQQEVFQAQLQRSQLEELRIGLEQQRRSLVAAINNLAYRPVETAVPPIGALTVQPYPLQAEELEQHAFADRPLLKSLQEKIDKAQAATRLAEKNIYPDVTVSLEYMQREPTASGSGDDMYTAGLTFNLPIQSDRRQAEIVENRMEQRAAVEDLAAARNEIHLKLADTLAQLERNQQQIALYEHGILDQAKGTVEAAMAGYRTDKGTFGDVLSSRMNLFNLEREYYRIVSEYLSQQAVLENIAGLSPEIK
jgi:outer membrane protein TolC